MPSTYDRLILGAGTTASVYLSFFPAGDEEKVGVIGLPEPWSQRGDHRMGQTPNLLMLPLDNPLRPENFDPLDANTGEPRLYREPQAPFLRSDHYAAQMQGLPQHNELREDAKYRTARVTSVTNGPDNCLKVSYCYLDDGARKYLYAKQVVVATGPGAPRNKNLPGGGPLNCYHSGDSYLNPTVDIRGTHIAVEGGSATAAWCVEKALLSGAEHVYWFVRPNPRMTYDERFGGAFPAGKRNEWLRGHPRVSRFLGTYSDTSRWVASDGGPRLELNFREYESVVVDQYVAAIGALETADYLGDLRNGLVPIVDNEGHVHLERDAILGYINDSRSVLVVGAGVYKVPGREEGETERYAKGNEYLPLAARPPEGIPTIIASIAALTRYMEAGSSKWIDINLANFSDLEEHFKRGIGMAFASFLSSRLPRVDQRLAARFIVDQVVGSRIMKSSPYGIKIEELQALYDNLIEVDEPMIIAWAR